MGVQVLQLKSQYAQLLQNYEALNARINGTYSSTSNNTNYNDLANSITNISARIVIIYVIFRALIWQI